ncbi:glycine zipper domain-containing protein [Prosthecobacter sp.]|uniref:glycine zipper domain-containing protein n=1 Tax=Prosthecobacter sp. TaxID=1965333 RepID=UPI001DCB147E|nr:glycine zipper domain-containing protein [Prosthecobacter sp.]MCB1277546.1 hypothetical protein [Prosthecobacter sp.]
MKTHSFRAVVILLVGASLTLTSCQYPYYNMGPNQRAGTLYGAAGGALLGGIASRRHPAQGMLIGGLIGGLAGNAIGASRDRYYYVNRSSGYGNRYYYGRPYSSSSYYRHPYYSNSSYFSPYYSRSPNYVSRYNYRPWGGGFGFGQPFGWGSGLGIGSRWF